MKIARYILSATFLIGMTLIASAQPAPTATGPAPAGTQKICTPFVPNGWRTVTPVYGTWGLDDCRNMGQAIGATTLQVGCFFEKEQTGLVHRYVFGAATGITLPPSPANIPTPNCGW